MLLNIVMVPLSIHCINIMNETYLEALLAARETRLMQINERMDDRHGVLCIKANSVGQQKNRPEAILLVRYFAKIIQETIPLIDACAYSSADGFYILASIEKDIIVKQRCIDIETTHSLGRFIDLDVYLHPDQSVSRASLNQPTRQCFLCCEPAWVCQREKRHSEEELVAFFQSKIKHFFSQILYKMISDSIDTELFLEDKFGLVTPTSCGSHPDMNVGLMLQAKEAIVDGFVEMFWLGVTESIDEAYAKAKTIGLLLEKKMMLATSNVNCYKGLIFILGLAVVASGHALVNDYSIDAMRRAIQAMTKDVFYEPKYYTFGEEAWAKHHFGGARKEAHDGLINVIRAYDILYRAHNLNDVTLHTALIDIIVHIEDSVMLKRAGSFATYQYFQSKIASLNPQDREAIQVVTNECISHQISCGGAADVLIAAIYWYWLDQTWFGLKQREKII